jgi:hypothetical protein
LVFGEQHWNLNVTQSSIGTMLFFCDCLRPQPKPKRIEGALGLVPKYRLVERSRCELLKLCWEKNWDGVLARCESHPDEAFCRSKNSDRTALHLATMPGSECPAPVLLTLLETNPHAVVVRDDQRYRGGTPLHFLCGSDQRNNADVIERYVQCALRFEKYNQKYNTASIGTDDAWSPLLLAAKMSARVETLQILVQTRSRTLWIAPWTGGESCPGINPLLSEADSPLCCLWTYAEAHLTDTPEETLPRMRQIAETMLADKNAWVQGISTDTEQEESWTKLLILLRVHIQGTLLHTVATLYVPIPGLVRLTATIFPEQAQEVDEEGCLPLHNFFRCPLDSWEPHHEEIVQILIETQPETLSAPDGIIDLKPVFLAALRDAPIGTLFSMLKACPVALELQRGAIKREV